jgi:hypothetical protein
MATKAAQVNGTAQIGAAVRHTDSEGKVEDYLVNDVWPARFDNGTASGKGFSLINVDTGKYKTESLTAPSWTFA